VVISGFDRDDIWGFRAVEPNRCCLSSIALVQLKTGINHEAAPDVNVTAVSVDQTQMTTAQKLLLFWRKPAVRTTFACISSFIDLVGRESAGGMVSRLTLGLQSHHESSNCGLAAFGPSSSAWYVIY
jgi:hypothetical protein